MTRIDEIHHGNCPHAPRVSARRGGRPRGQQGGSRRGGRGTRRRPGVSQCGRRSVAPAGSRLPPGLAPARGGSWPPERGGHTAKIVPRLLRSDREAAGLFSRRVGIGFVFHRPGCRRGRRAGHGSGLKVIVPAGNPLRHLEKRIGEGNLFYVSTVDELLAATLDSQVDSRGLVASREAVFRTLSPDIKVDLTPHLAPGVPADIYERPRLWTEPVTHPDQIYSTCSAWNDRLDLSVAPDPVSLQRPDARCAARTLVQVIVDGSAAMDAHWGRDSSLGTSRMAAAVFQMASRIDPAREDLVVGFLSCESFEPVRPGSAAPHIEALLERVRQKRSLRHRGAFVRPLREASLATYGARRKRIYLLTESDVPDWDDVEDCLVESSERLRLLAGHDTGAANALFAADGTLNAEALDLRFHRLATAIPEICVSVGPELPVEIDPPEGAVMRCDGGYAISWSDPAALNWRIRLRLSGMAPHQVKVSGSLLRRGERHEFSFPALATRTCLEPIGQVVEGVLQKGESDLWRTICTPQQACPQCGRKDVHLLHEDPLRLLRQPLFTLPASTSRWLLMRANDSGWTLFKTGCRMNGLSIAFVDGCLHYSEARQHLMPMPTDAGENGLYRLERNGDNAIYITGV